MTIEEDESSEEDAPKKHEEPKKNESFKRIAIESDSEEEEEEQAQAETPAPAQSAPKIEEVQSSDDRQSWWQKKDNNYKMFDLSENPKPTAEVDGVKAKEDVNSLKK